MIQMQIQVHQTLNPKRSDQRRSWKHRKRMWQHYWSVWTRVNCLLKKQSSLQKWSSWYSSHPLQWMKPWLAGAKKRLRKGQVRLWPMVCDWWLYLHILLLNNMMIQLRIQVHLRLNPKWSDQRRNWKHRRHWGVRTQMNSIPKDQSYLQKEAVKTRSKNLYPYSKCT